MQTNSDSTLESAADKVIKSQERHFVASVWVDWDQDGSYGHVLSDLTPYVESVATDRSLKGSAPEEIMLIEGASAAELDLTMSGEFAGLPLTGVFSPYNGNSPLYNNDPMGAEITYALGVETVLGTVWYQQFIGNVRTITPDRGENTVQLTALDFVEKMRQPITFTPWAISEYWATRGRWRGQLCDTQWMLQACLLDAGASATPYMPGPYTAFWLPATGGHMPTLGILDNSPAQQFPYTESTGTEMYSFDGDPHPAAPEPTKRPLAFSAMGGEDGRVNRYWKANRAQGSYDSVHVLGLTLNTRSTGYQTIAAHAALKVWIGYNWAVQLVIGTGQVWTELVDLTNGNVLGASAKLTIPTNGTSQRIWALWDNTPWNSKPRVSVSCGTLSTGAWATTAANALDNSGRADDQLEGLIETRHGCSINDYSYGVFFYDGSSGYRPDPTLTTWDRANAWLPASLDSGLNRFTYTPVVHGDDAWEIVTGVAAAEYGSVFWDEQGKFHFWNYNTMKGKQSNLVRSLTLDEVSGLQITNTLDSVRNTWTVATKTRKAVAGTIYSSQSVEEFYLPANTSKSFVVNVDAVSVEPWFLTQYTTQSNGNGVPIWNQDVTGGFIVAQYGDLGDGQGTRWYEVWYGVNVSVVAYLNFSGQLTIQVSNGTTLPIRFSTNGQAALRIPGTTIVDRGSGSYTWSDQTSVQKYGTRNLKLEGDWYQDQFQSNNMLGVLGPRTTVPIPTTDAVTIAGDPRLQLGDCIEVRDPDGVGEQTKLQIYGIRREWSLDSGLTDTLTVEMLRPPRVGIWDSQQYGRWDETFIWS
ncbi:hypothetical protein [Amycolatopsis sp.]|uniref:hypothetical protein n=1 Tax=Amycolatopsis sp. TaxID=37632 RepID=UPI002BB5939F|nr:hypothetical protein [Amycolatopsis sp.]HVV11573.1 hypothetical protein [Amycolatopsis sp.]